MNKREQQRLERRQQILNCSLDMIISRGFEAMKIRDIADKLNISTGLFFNYFESKEKIYEELVKIALSGSASFIDTNQKSLRPIEFFERMTRAVFESFQSYPMAAKMFLLMSQTVRSEMAPKSVKDLVAHFDPFTPVLPIIIKGQQLGEIKAGNPTALAVAYWGAVQGISESVATRPELPLPSSSWIVDILRS